MNATNKGVALQAGRVMRGTQDGFLYALDADQTTSHRGRYGSSDRR